MPFSEAWLSGMARHLNRQWKRRGKVFADRYHSETITTPTQCRHALVYVLANAKKHGSLPLEKCIDPYSTAPWFPYDSNEPDHPLRHYRKPAAQPKNWLLREGWRKIAPISPQDHPRMPQK